MAVDPAVASIAAMVAVQGVSMVREYLPDVSEVLKADPSQHADFTAAVRAGELSALTGVAIVAVTAYAVTGNTAPLLAGAGAALAMVALYEVILRNRKEATTS